MQGMAQTHFRSVTSHISAPNQKFGSGTDPEVRGYVIPRNHHFIAEQVKVTSYAARHNFLYCSSIFQVHVQQTKFETKLDEAHTVHLHLHLSIPQH